MRLIIVVVKSYINRTLPVFIAISTLARLIGLVSVNTSDLPEEDQVKAEQVYAVLRKIGRVVQLITEAAQVIRDVTNMFRPFTPAV